MKTILLLDTETTGLDPKKDQVIEVAVARYDLDHGTVIDSFASLICCSRGNDAEHINRIPAAALPGAPAAELVWDKVKAWATTVDAVAAHRAEFDKGFVEAAIGGSLAAPWMCTKFDTPWPRQNKPGASLVQLALDLDLGVAYAHRAATDVDLMARVFTRAKELGADLKELVRLALRPKSKMISLAPFEQKDIVKQAGFNWDPTSKVWWRSMPSEDAAKLPFKCRVEEQAA